LKAQKWSEAMGPEQKGLQNALRAEATFRDIQVAFGSRGAVEAVVARVAISKTWRTWNSTGKNQYETGQQSAADQQAKKVDDALQNSRSWRGGSRNWQRRRIRSSRSVNVGNRKCFA